MRLRLPGGACRVWWRRSQQHELCKCERVIWRGIEQRIAIAHRLSTVRHCDRILVVDGGAIAEEGTYEELLAKDGLFAELVKRQRLDTGACS